MSEEINLMVNEPKAIVDPYAVSFSAQDMVFCSMASCKVKEVDAQIDLTVISPNPQAIEQFTNHFSARVNSAEGEADSEHSAPAVVVFKRVVADREDGPQLANTDLLLDIAAFDMATEGVPIVVKLDIDPEIAPGHTHVYTFVAKPSTDGLTVTSKAPEVCCKLYNWQVSDLRGLAQQARAQRLATSESETMGFQLDKPKLDEILGTLKKPLIEKPVSTVAEEFPLNGVAGREYALVIQAIGTKSRKYAVHGEIILR